MANEPSKISIVSEEKNSKFIRQTKETKLNVTSNSSLTTTIHKIVECLCCEIHQNPNKNIPPEKLKPYVKDIIQLLKQKARGHLNNVNDIFGCLICQGVLSEPITLQCGHTFCKKCIYNHSERCQACNKPIKDVSQLKCNVLILSIIERCWPQEVESIKIRIEANRIFKENKLKEALSAYTAALEKAPHDHILLSNRCRTYQLLGWSEEALSDAEAACCLRPFWPKGHFRKAASLVSLGRLEEALVSFLLCGVLEDKDGVDATYLEIAKLLLLLLKKEPWCKVKKLLAQKKQANSIFMKDENDTKEDSHLGENLKIQEAKKNKLTLRFPNLLVRRSRLINRILVRFQKELTKDKMSTAYCRRIELNRLDKSDFECTLCFHYFLEPVSTPCGHTFCRTCLDRTLDYVSECPLCKTSLKEHMKDRLSSTTEFIDEAAKALFPTEVLSRKDEFEHEMNQYALAGKDKMHEIPIFVATVALPSICCPLHVYEPRYRLMIRRCMEVGTREFGMCMPCPQEENGYPNIGTMLEIREVEYTEDGRSIVSGVGSRRFRCLSKGTKDGYNTAKVEFLADAPIRERELQEMKKSHDVALGCAQGWFDGIEAPRKRRILHYYGSMPAVESEYWNLPNGPSWMWWFIAILPLEPVIQMRILKELSLKKRLAMIVKIVKLLISIKDPNQDNEGNS